MQWAHTWLQVGGWAHGALRARMQMEMPNKLGC